MLPIAVMVLSLTLPPIYDDPEQATREICSVNAPDVPQFQGLRQRVEATPEWQQAQVLMEEIAQHILKSNHLSLTLARPARLCLGPSPIFGVFDTRKGEFLLVQSKFLRMAAKTDSELAFHIAHELSHALLHHIRDERLLSKEIAKAHFGPIPTEERIWLMEQKRDMELEADRLGMTLMRRAGYDPQAALSFFESWLKLGEEPFNPATSQFPPLKVRIEAAGKIQRTLSAVHPETQPVNHLFEIEELIDRATAKSSS